MELEYQLGDSEDECWQLSYRGAFAWAGGISSDLKQQSPNFNFPPPPQRWLSFKDIIFSVTEQFRFAANLAEALACENLWIRVQLHNVKQRTLGSYDPEPFIWGSQVSSEDSITLDALLTKSELMSAWKEYALDWVRKVFTVFQWPDFDKKLIADFQQKLIERRW